MPPPPEPAAGEPVALLLTDIVGSAALEQQLGDAAMATVWAAHDRAARDLLHLWHGREIDKTDGFLLLFAQAADALGYALAYHRALATLPLPQPANGAVLRLRARAGLHVAVVALRENPAADVARGAKPLEVDGVAKPLAARVMSTALGGQTLLSAAARDALAAAGALPQRLVSHGHWRVKGMPDPLELFEAGDDAGGSRGGAPFTPPPDGDKVYRVVRQGELWLPVRELRHSLPAERDAFVGRRSSLQALARRFDDGARLVSLLAIGGCGKTRLATRFGWSWMGEFPGGVWFCDLAQARSIDGLCSAVAMGLGAPLGGDDPVQQIGHVIAGRGNCLLILDNFEQVARHAEASLGRWLGLSTQARFLVTTREVLGIAGEETLALAPLAAREAEKLFLRRAAAAQQDALPTAEDLAAVAPLVQLLDGLPLAIELAAARVRTLAPHMLLARMSERFKLLASSGSRHDRQATLRATFDWSWELLAAAEKAALAQLSVFEGGFTLDAAEAVIDLEATDADAWVPDVIHSLVDKSFVRPLGGGRFDLLVSVQAYAAEHLCKPDRYPGSGDAALQAAQARHGDWFAALGPTGAAQGAGADLDNLVAACRRAVAGGAAARAAGALQGAWAALEMRGPFVVATELAAEVCAMPGLADQVSPAAAQARAVLGLALEALGQPAQAALQLASALQAARAAADGRCEAVVTVHGAALQARSGGADDARASLQHALQLAQQLHDPVLACEARCALGTVDFEQGQMDAAQQHYEVALAQARQIGNLAWQGRLLGNLGNVHASRGQFKPAQRHCEEALALMRQLGDRKREGNQLSNLSTMHLLQGRLAEAGQAAEAAIAVARELGHARLECAVLENLGAIHEAAGHRDLAQARWEDAIALARRLLDRRAEGQLLGPLGLLRARQGDSAGAREHLQRGAALLREAGDELGLALLLCRHAEVEWLAGDATAAARACDQAAGLAAAVGAGPGSELDTELAHLSAMMRTGGCERVDANGPTRAG